jgi:flagellar biogenesis protein FliO
MKTYVLTLALILGLGGSVLAQAQSNTAPQKLVAEVSSAPPLGSLPASASAKAAPARTEKPKVAAPENKPKPAAPTTETKTDTKTETKASTSAAATEAKPEAERLPFKLAERAEAMPPPPSLAGLLLRTLGALLFLVGLIAAAGWALRYFGILNFGKAQVEAAGLKVINTLPLGERRSLLMVKFGERTLLIGATPQGLSLLAEQHEEPMLPGNYETPVQTVTDLLAARSGTQFEEEMAQAALTNPWYHRSTQR